METFLPSDQAETVSRRLLVDGTTRRIPLSVPLLSQYQYVERTIHRLLTAWGRQMADWDGKAALHRHVWDQAEIIRRLRDRIQQFPGGKPDAAVAMAFERLADAALLAPTFQDALDGIYKILLRALAKAYADYVQHSHPVHDAPSLNLFHEINTIKEQHYFWYRSYRRQHPHTTDRGYEERLNAALAGAGHFGRALPLSDGEAGLPCRPRSEFTLPKVSARPAGWAPPYNLYPYFSLDFATDVEARRLFWAVAYLQEMNLPDDQLAWIHYGGDMPWEWHHDISRHLWDESRHGCSGYSRLQDWGISLSDVGFFPYSAGHLLRHPEGTPLAETLIRPYVDEGQVDFTIPMEPLSAAALYQIVFHIGMVAESGHFMVKNEGYDDFRQAEDLESAEMMLFDIIDETTHVQYAHRWLPLLAEKAGLDNSDYKQRAVAERRTLQEGELRLIEEAKTVPRTPDFAPWRHYQDLLTRIRQANPIKNAAGFQPRSIKPM